MTPREQLAACQRRLPSVWHDDQHLAAESRFGDPTDFWSLRSTLPQDKLPCAEKSPREDKVVLYCALVVPRDDVVLVPHAGCFVHVKGYHALRVDYSEKPKSAEA